MTQLELFELAHEMWCGPGCTRTTACEFLHYPRVPSKPGLLRVTRPPYNRGNAHLFVVAGGDRYLPGIPQLHEVNLWDHLPGILARDGTDVDYTCWSRKGDTSAADVIRYCARDAVQWAAIWCGERQPSHQAFLEYLLLNASADDLCVPPLDLVHGNYRVYGRTLADIVRAMDKEGWGYDAVLALLSIVRLYLFQYTEKLDHVAGRGLCNGLRTVGGAWDAIMFHMMSGNTFGVGLGVASTMGAGPCRRSWLLDGGFGNATSMNLAKSLISVEGHDLHHPTGDDAAKQTAYRSFYLDIIGELTASGAPEPLVYFARAGFDFVPLGDRYRERRRSERFPLRPAVAVELREVFGDEPCDEWLEGRFRAATA
ncbi:hypothetical protein AB5J72_35860 [Streptomyces sp. CG1]|uniref:hypothetical protein n=1 Tax=Streptomyces sp. CG1 TaxID=1287523 RepID=UPI0034E2B277